MKSFLLKLLTFFISILIFLNTIFISSLFVLNFKYLYYLDINYLGIKNSSGLSEEIIKENYNYTINYVNDNSLTEYSPPSLKSSQDGKDHFKDVQNIFSNIKKIIGPSIIMILLGVFILKKFKYPKKYLKFSSILLTCSPLLLALTFAFDFDWIFTLFHKTFFNNDKWLFDPRYDEIITILPEDYFMHCASLILIISIIVGIVLLLIYKKKDGSISLT